MHARASIVLFSLTLAVACRDAGSGDPAAGTEGGPDTSGDGTHSPTGAEGDSPTSAGSSGGPGSTGADATGDPECERCGGDACLDLQADEAHCGACGAPCPEHATCVDGECRCADGLTACGETCVNHMADPAHCGGCEMPCAAGLVCNGGACTEGCGDLTECSGGCFDTTSDPFNCGGCGQACDGAQACAAGRCSCGGAVSYAAEVEPIMVAECTNMGCHRPPVNSAGLDLTAGAGWAALVEVPSSQCGDRLLVSPGAAAESYLLDKLHGQNLCFGSQMPKAGQSLPAADLEAITSWICNGAEP